MNREAIYAALFATVSPLQGAGLTVVSRRMEMVDEMQTSRMPALFQRQLGQVVTKTPALPPKFEFGAEWAIYVHQPDRAQPMTPQLNALVDAASAALRPKTPLTKQNLGGLVEDAAIDGTIEIYEGLLEDRAVAIIPIRILLPGW